MKRILFSFLVIAILMGSALVASGVQTSKTAEVLSGTLKLIDDMTLIFGAGNDATVQYDEDGTDRLQVTTGATSGLFLDTGNLFVGNGTPGQTINGEDLYVNGLAEIDGVIYADGGALVPDDVDLTFGTDADASIGYDEAGDDVLKIVGTVWFMEGSDPTVFAGPVFMQNSGAVADDETFGFGDDGDWVCGFDETTSDDLQCTALAGASVYNVLVGNLAVGNGTPGVALDGEDAYIEGTIEVDGAAKLDGAVTAASLTVSGSVRLTAPGWVPAAGANTSCVTTCGISNPVMAFDAGTTALVALDSATADSCYCDGPTS